MKLVEVSCGKCGGKLKEEGGGKYKCSFCGAVYYEDHLQKEVEMLSSILDTQKQERISALRRLLWKELNKEYIDGNEISSLSGDILKLYPDDFYANFYYSVCGKSEIDECEFLDNIDVNRYFDAIPDVLSFMFKSLSYRNLLSVGNLIERAYAKSRRDYERYMTEFEKEAENVRQGIYDPSFPRDVFVMYSSADMEKVKSLVGYLEEQGITCFVAARNLQHGKNAVANYQRALETAMDNCKAIVFVSSSNSRSLKCDVIRLEMPYIKKQDLSTAPVEYKNRYDILPDKYKKPRVEYVIEAYTGKNSIERITKEFFGTLQWAQTEEAVVSRVTDIILTQPEVEDENGKILELLRQSEELRKKEAEEAEAKRQRDIEELKRSFLQQFNQQREGNENRETDESAQREKEEEDCKRGIELYNRNKYEEAIPLMLPKAKWSDDKFLLDRLAWAYDQTKNYSEALNWYKKSGELGSAFSQDKVGWFYYKGYMGTPQNYNEAVKWYKKAVEQNYSEAEFNLAICYYYGNGVEKNYEEAAKLFKKSAEQSHLTAQSWMGYIYQYGNGVKKDLQEAIKWYKIAAEKGDTFSQNKMGEFYYNGNGVNKDYSEAFRWFKKSADQGNKDAQSWMGYVYEYGNGATQNYAEAAKWYKMAAEKGNDFSQNRLGIFYYNGRGVKKDYSEAFRWFKKSADQGYAAAQGWVGYLYENGEGVDKNQDEAAKWYKLGAEKGDDFSQNKLGVCYYKGRGVKKDYSEAFKWFKKSADQGYATAQGWVGYLYENGEGVDKNQDEAAKWYKLGAENGNDFSQNKLGVCYYNGRGVKKDYSEAFKWFKKSADQGYASAQSWMGFLYERGEGVKKNRTEAIMWYEKGAAQGDSFAKEALKRIK